ncbi:MAG: polyphosphate kinase 1, partial [Leptospiraceae bacterium]|nr:polyphosphate kinase 1 [Leptospiraceae bacterium]
MSESTTQRKTGGERAEKPGETNGRKPEKREHGGHWSLNKNNYQLFINRELSWLQFNSRVLEEAMRKDNPLLERLKFAAIVESNQIEFFMIRVAGLKQLVASSVKEIQMDGRTPLETIQEISRVVHEKEINLYRALREIMAGLETYHIHIVQHFEDLDRSEKKFVADYFKKEVFRVLTPMAIDPGHPFPHLSNDRLYLAVTLRRKTAQSKQRDTYAIIEVPSVLNRFLELPVKKSKSETTRRFIPLEEVVKMHVNDLFAGTSIKSIHGFHLIRNSDLSIDEVVSDNLLSTIEDVLKNRRWGEAVRLTYRRGMPETIREFLRDRLDLEPYEMYERPGLLRLQDLMELYSYDFNIPALRDRDFIPRNAIPLESPDLIFKAIRKKDHLLHHPYDSFQPIVDMLQFAARDPKVLAIKQTLYRTGRDSPIVKSLIQAAENGKQVTALVELKARFDEERNIEWAKQMEKHGVHVVYGLVGLKIHGKMLQIIRRETNGVKAYCHLATGNYNPVTARLYTDFGHFTADPEINDDVTNLFHSLTGYATLPKFSKIAAAPINLRENVMRMINREISNARAKKPAVIRAKMNSLVDADIILALYRASRAGVKIELIVRGICCLRPGIKGLSENITVYSIVGRFLEHSRIFYFENAGSPKVYLSSADWMPRNLNRRVEILFPINDADHIQRIVSIMDTTSRDNHNKRVLNPDGSYTRIKPGTNENRFSAQRYFREEALKESRQTE